MGELDVAFCDDAEAGCELDERNVEVGGVRVGVECELRSLEIRPFERLWRSVREAFANKSTNIAF